MSSKLGQAHDIMEQLGGRNSSKLVETVFSSKNSDGTARVPFKEISVDRITFRSVNQYSQGRIDRLAKSIRNTNNRLIHPIVVALASDLPQDGEVIKKFREKGVDVSTLEYVIVAGERRFRAWLKLREEEEKLHGGEIGFTNQFDTITCNILSRREAQNEAAYFEDSNLESRQLTPAEAILHIKQALEEVQTDVQKRDALIEMNEGKAEGIPEDPSAAAKKFNQANYCLYYLATELGIDGWSVSTVKQWLSVINQCIPEVVDAAIAGEIKASKARDFTDKTEAEQMELLELLRRKDNNTYKTRLAEIEASKKKTHKTIRYTHKDAQSALKDMKRNIEKSQKKLSTIVAKLGADDKKEVSKIIKSIDDFLGEISEKIETLN